MPRNRQAVKGTQKPEEEIDNNNKSISEEMDEESEASNITVKSSADAGTCLNGCKTSMEMTFDVLRSDLKEDLMKSIEDIVSNAVSNAIRYFPKC